ncbi:MAG: 3-keto-L-gulonate-6-phosphate decarboxylase UlaD [Streptococcaceae bacterium]|nr:3-keto-L-gulonate-6-phosphate decarboxylase UlaD [Streptococcaceae bacterium]
MKKPKLQLACDQSSLKNALKDISKVGEIVDIIECGTILLLQEGELAIECLRALFPDKIIVADTKCADAGQVVARNVSEAGADWMTCICSATLPTMRAAASEVAEVQVELYGDWTIKQAEQWLDIGVHQVIYHQSRDALLNGETWSKKDLNRIKQLIDMGFQVSVTGGLVAKRLKLFKRLNVYAFIAGRAITNSENPVSAALEFQVEINRLWGS